VYIPKFFEVNQLKLKFNVYYKSKFKVIEKVEAIEREH
jgi:hypothetical protein